MDPTGLPADRGMSAISLPMTCSTGASNGSTVVGIGSVAGRVIMSVGEFALKGVEVVHIQRSISLIYATIVESEGRGVLDDKAYKELLELSR